MAQPGKTYLKPPVASESGDTEEKPASRAESIRSVTSSQDNDEPKRPETALTLEKPVETFDLSGSVAYQNACKTFRIPKSRSVMSQLQMATHTLDVSHYGLGPIGCRALSVPIVLNSSINTLIVSDNNIGIQGLEILCNSVRESVSINAIDVSHNNLGSPGATILAKFLSKNHNMKSLNFAGNLFLDNDAKVLCEPLEENKMLLALDLSHNRFSVMCGEAFERLLVTNEILKELDLSWNAIRLRAVRAICRGLKANITLESINLAWNGLGPSDAREIAGVLAAQTRLLQVDFSSNRIPAKSFPFIAKAVLDNEVLESFRYGYNPMTHKDGKDFIKALATRESSQLHEVWLMGIFFDKEFEENVEQLKKEWAEREQGSILVVHGYNDLYGKRKLKGYNPATEAMEIIKAFLVQHNVKLVDLFAEFDEDGSMSVSYDEFRLGLKKSGIELTEQQVDALIHELDADGDGDIDFSEFAIGAEDTDD